MTKLRRLTQKDRDRIKERFWSSKIGKTTLTFLYKYKGIWLINFIFMWEFSYYFILGTLRLTVYTPQPNIIYGLILWHAYTHHLTDLMCFGIGYTYLMIKLRNAIYPALFVGYVIAVSEYSWWFSYIIAHWENIFVYAQWERIYFSNQLTVIYAILIITYVVIKGFDKRDLLWIVYLWVYFAIWIYIGFPITYDFNGPTQYLYSLNVNLIEVGHWIYSFAGYFIITHYTHIKRRILRDESFI